VSNPRSSQRCNIKVPSGPAKWWRRSVQSRQQPHDFEPDFIIRLAGGRDRFLILETKGYDPLGEVKKQAANRWIGAVNAEGRHGIWQFAMLRRVGDVRGAIATVATS
jgi:hypothetical protein